MVNHVAEAMHVDVCSIYLLDERNKPLCADGKRFET